MGKDKPAKIANLKMRMDEYKREMKHWVYFQIPFSLIVGMTVCFGMMYIASVFVQRLESSWVGLSVVFFVASSIPYLVVSCPKRPKQADVDADVALRKAFNIDSTVSDE